MSAAVHLPLVSASPAQGQATERRPQAGFESALDRATGRGVKGSGESTSDAAAHDAPETRPGRQDAAHASETGLASRAAHASVKASHRRSEPTPDADTEPIELTGTAPDVVAAAAAGVQGTVDEVVPSLDQAVDALAQELASLPSAPMVAAVRPTPSGPAVAATRSILPQSPVDGDLPIGLDGPTPAPVQPLAAASLLPGSGVESQEAAAVSAASQVAVETAAAVDGSVDPVQESGGDGPATPARSSTTAESVEPAQPARPVQPAQPAQPVQPAQPAGQDTEHVAAVAATTAPPASAAASAEVTRAPATSELIGRVRGVGGAPRLLDGGPAAPAGDESSQPEAATAQDLAVALDPAASEPTLVVPTAPAEATGVAPAEFQALGGQTAASEAAGTEATSKIAPLATTAQNVAEHVPAHARGSAVVQRLLDVAKALENAPPPRSVVVELESMRGLRLEVRLGEAGAVHVLAKGNADAVQPLASLGRDLADALAERGMDFGGFETRDEDGTAGRGTDRDQDQQQAQGRGRPGIRPGAGAAPNPGRTVTGLRL